MSETATHEPFVDLECPGCKTTYSDMQALDEVREEVDAKEAGIGRIDPLTRERLYQLMQRERARKACPHDHGDLLAQANAQLDALVAAGLHVEHNGMARGLMAEGKLHLCSDGVAAEPEPSEPEDDELGGKADELDAKADELPAPATPTAPKPAKPARTRNRAK